MGFARVTYRNMGEGLLTGAEMTQRWLCHQSLSQPEWWLIKSGNAKHTLRPAGSSTGCRVFPGGRDSLNLFQAAQLLFAPSKQFCWSLPGCSTGLRVTDSRHYYLYSLERAGPSESGQLAFFFSGYKVSIQDETAIQHPFKKKRITNRTSHLSLSCSLLHVPKKAHNTWKWIQHYNFQIPSNMV